MKTFPKLEKLLHAARERKRQTPEEMLAVARMLTVAFGGKIVERKKD